LLTVFLRSVLRLLIIANVAPSSPILVTLMMEAVRSSENPILIRATRRNIAVEGIHQRGPARKPEGFEISANSETVLSAHRSLYIHADLRSTI
jgi:hypothetical protein